MVPRIWSQISGIFGPFCLQKLRVGALTELVTEMCASGLETVPKLLFPKLFPRIAFGQICYFCKKTSSLAGIFIFYQVQKFWSGKKVRSLFSRPKNFKNLQKFFENLENFQCKINENQKISIFKMLDIFDFHSFSIENFSDFRKIFWRILKFFGL